MMWLLQDVNVHPWKILYATYLPHGHADSGNHCQISHLGSIHEAQRTGLRSGGAFVPFYKVAGRTKGWSFRHFFPREAGSRHGLNINALMGFGGGAFAKFRGQNGANRGFRLKVGNNGNASGEKVREIM